MHPENIEAAKPFGLRHGFKVWTGTRYLGSYIRDGKSKHEWLKNCMDTWERNIHTIRKLAGGYPPVSYNVVVHIIQSEWIFLKCVTKNMGDAFVRVEKMIWETFYIAFSS